MKIVYEPVLETKNGKIRQEDIISMEHKDGRTIRGRLNEITDSMLYISQVGGTEIVQVGSIMNATKV